MKKFIVVLFFINGLIVNVVAQQKGFELQGVLSVDSVQTISIKLIFDVDSNGNITGTSITDYEGEDKTISKIEGQFNPEKNSLSFRETENVSTSSSAESSSFCFIEASGLQLRLQEGSTRVNGNFKGFFANGNPCASGLIKLQGEQLKMPAKVEPVVAAKPGRAEQEKLDNTKPKVELFNLGADGNTELTDGSSKNFRWKSDTVALDVWDQYEEDNDRVNIYFNGKLVYKSIEVKNRKRTFYFPANQANNSLRIEADNEGTNPPNTVNVRLKDRGDVQLYNTRLKKGESVNIEIVKNASARTK